MQKKRLVNFYETISLDKNRRMKNGFWILILGVVAVSPAQKKRLNVEQAIFCDSHNPSIVELHSLSLSSIEERKNTYKLCLQQNDGKKKIEMDFENRNSNLKRRSNCLSHCALFLIFIVKLRLFLLSLSLMCKKGCHN